MIRSRSTGRDTVTDAWIRDGLPLSRSSLDAVLDTPLFAPTARMASGAAADLLDTIADGVRTGYPVSATITPSGSDSALLSAVRQAVLAGTPLSAALAEHPDTFPDRICHVIRTGEQFGHLPAALQRAAQLLREDTSHLRALAATGKAAGIAAASLLTVLSLAGWLAGPVLAAAAHPHRTPSLATAALVAARWMPVAAAAVALIVMLLRSASRMPLTGGALRARTQDVLLRIPAAGALLRLHAQERLASHLAWALTLGQMPDEAVRAAGAVTGLASYAEAAERAAGATCSVGLLEALADEPTLTPLAHALRGSAPTGAAAELERRAQRDRDELAARLTGLNRRLNTRLSIASSSLAFTWLASVAVPTLTVAAHR